MDYLVYIMNNDEEVRDQFHNYAAGGEAFVRNGELLDMGTHWKATKNTLYVYRSIDDSQDTLQAIIFESSSGKYPPKPSKT